MRALRARRVTSAALGATLLPGIAAQAVAADGDSPRGNRLGDGLPALDLPGLPSPSGVTSALPTGGVLSTH
ncbi:hypothetical protein [Streptomyces sp. 142MFCol3.1]|uniref:hypothetical protein n=1 Tax=Streptomyces sp. 142MFCol3.1 TaxID=1172179 RepID=UPI0003F4D769|nr:hypothetical protein [Streptomyces sp. 142MFCol3.1]